MLYDGDIFERNGRRYKVAFPHDDSGDTPWDRQSFGVVSDYKHHAFGQGTKPPKKPGEMILYWDRGTYRTFDFAETCRQYRNEGCTRKEAAESAMADFKLFKGWCEDRWTYVGVVVTLLDDDDEKTDKSASLWGIESDADDYLETTAYELADDAAHWEVEELGEPVL